MSYDDENKRRLDALRKVQADAVGRRKSDVNREGFVNLNERQKVEYWNMKDRTDTWSLGTETSTSQRKIRYYVTLSDATLGVYVPKAKATARAEFLKGFRTWYHHYTIDIVEVSIRIFGRNIHIDISPVDNFDFEFVTSAKPIKNGTMTDRGASLQLYLACVVRVAVKGQNNQIGTTSRIVEWRRQEAGENFSAVNRPQQTELITESVLYPYGKKVFSRWRFPRTVLESYCPAHSHNGVHYRDTQVGENPLTTALGPVYPLPNPGPTSQHSVRDISWDMPWADNTALDPVRWVDLKGTTDDFPRNSSIQTVTSTTHGTREFAVSVDSFGVFRIFPTAAIKAQDPLDVAAQDVDELYVQRVTPSFPGWVYQATTRQIVTFPTSDVDTDTLQKSLIDNPELDWRFNSVGTKAAVIAYEREAIAFDSTYYGTNQGANPLTQAQFDSVRDVMGVIGRIGADAIQPTYSTQRYLVAPGVFEASIDIVLTGDNLENYTATVDITETRRPTTSVYCPMVVGYPWQDILDPVTKAVKVAKDTLVSFDIERWGNKGAAPYYNKITDILALRRLDTEAVIQTWRAMPMLAVDMTTLSFVVLVQELKTDRTAVFPSKISYPGGGTITLKMADFSFAACIVHSLTIKEYLFPDTLPLDTQLRLVDSFSLLSGYEYKATLSGTWVYSPLANADDGWGNSDIANVRDVWGNSVGYKTYTAPGANYSITRDTIFGLWGQELGDDIHMMYLTNPKWGWNCYQSALCSNMYIDPRMLFYAHPNGTYAFYNDSWIYNPNGQPIGETVGGTFFGADCLSVFDASALEHVIFDRVHFELRTPLGTATKKHSFFDLYNKAVQAGMNNKKLENKGIDPMLTTDLRATFTKEEYEIPSGPYIGVKWLLLTMNLNGGIWRFEEPGVSGGAYYNITIPKICGMVGVNLGNERWQPDPGQAFQPPYVANSSHDYFYRFANPLVLSALR